MKRVRCSLLVVLGMALACPAAADEPNPVAEPSLADKETARTLFFEGDEKYRAGEYEAALRAFEAADQIMGLPTTGLEVARSLMKLDRLLEAIETLVRVANLPQPRGEMEVQQQARRDAAELLEQVRAEVPSLVVVVKGPADEEERLVMVDGVQVPRSAQGFPRKLDPGEHEVRVEAAGYRPAQRKLRLLRGQHERTVLELEPLEPLAPSAPSHEEAEPEPEATWVSELPLWGWVGFGVGGAGLLVGTIAGGVSVARASDLEESCGGLVCPESQRDELEEARRVAHLSSASFVIAGVGLGVGATALVLRLLDDQDESQAACRPFVGPTMVGMTGRF